MKSASKGALSGCLVWTIVFGIPCVSRITIVTGSETCTVTADFAMCLPAPYLCPPESSPEIHTSRIITIALRSMAQRLQRQGYQGAFGGCVFNQSAGLREHIPAHFLGVTLEAGLQTAETLATRPTPSPDEKILSEGELTLTIVSIATGN